MLELQGIVQAMQLQALEQSCQVTGYCILLHLLLVSKLQRVGKKANVVEASETPGLL